MAALVGQHGTVSYLVSITEEQQEKIEKLQAQLEQIKAALEKVLFKDKRKKLLLDEPISVLLPSTALRSLRKVAKQYIEATFNDGKAARVFKETNQIILNLADPHFLPLLQELHATPQIFKQKLKTVARIPREHHRQIMGWGTNPPFGLVIPLE